MADALPDVESLFPIESSGSKELPDVETLFPTAPEEQRRYRQINTGNPNPSPLQDFLFSNEGPVGTVWHSAGRVLDAFGHGFLAAGPAESLSKEEETKLKDWVGYKDWSEQSQTIARAANRVLLRPAALQLSAIGHTVSGLMTGPQAAVAQLGAEVGQPTLGREIAALPEAFPFGFHGGVPSPEAIANARALKIIGPDGEAGWKGTAPAREEPPPPAREPGEPAPPAPPPTVQQQADSIAAAAERKPPPAPASIHEAAAAIDPEVMQQYDVLAQRRDTFRRWIDELRETRDQQYEAGAPHAEAIANLQARIDNPDTTNRLRKKYEERLAPLVEDRDAYLAEKPVADSADMANIRARLQQVDYQMRDLAPRRANALRAAAKQYPDLAPQEVAPTHAVEPPTRPTEAASAEALPPVKPEVAPAAERVPPRAKAPAPTQPAAPTTAATQERLPLSPGGKPPEALASPVERTPAPAPQAGGATEASPTSPGAEPVSPVRTIEQQRDFIKNDVARQLIAAGRSKEEAEAAGAIWAANFETLSAQFNGALGTAEELYRREGAEILGPGMRAQQPVIQRPSVSRKVNESLIPFLRSHGGISPSDPLTGDLKAILGDNSRIFREGGMTLDRAREAAAEAGYIINEGRGGTENRGGGTSTIRDLLDAISEESRGRKRYRPGMEPRAGKVEGREPTPEELEEASRPLEPEAESELMTDEDREAAGLELLQPKQPEASATIAGVRFEGTIAQLEQLKEARKAGAGRDEIQRMVDGFKGQTTSPKADLASRIENAYRKLRAEKRYDFIDIADIRDALPDVPLADLHSELKRNPRFNLIPNDNKATLTDRDRAAELKIGGNPRHKMFMAGREAVGLELLQRQRPTEPSDLHDIPGFHIGPNFRSPNELYQIKAYHGSPHDFDRFDLSKIGTGEGNQAFGRGLYFAGNEDVARSYRDQLSAPPDMSPAEDLAHQYLSMTSNRKEAIKELEKAVKGASDTDYGRDNAEALKLLKSGWEAPPSTGKIYEVKIDADPEDFLDWDEPLHEQPQKVQDALKSLGQSPGGKYLSRPGEVAIKSLTTSLRDAAKVSEALRSAGIPGIKYLDQGSRSAGEGTRNYVVFDDKLIEITHKDGTPVTGKDRDDIVTELLQPARGKINLNPAGAPGRDLLGVADVKPILRLTKDANASTFIHESGHMFLAQLLRYAEHQLAPEQLKADAQTALKWLGIDKPENLTVAAHEKFARGFEQYLREGTAPSAGLARVFGQFRQWLLSIYETIKGLGKPINEDIRQVFDRMLAEKPERQPLIVPDRELPPSHIDALEAEVAHAEQHAPEKGIEIHGKTETEIGSIAGKNLVEPERHELLGDVGENRPAPPQHPEAGGGGAQPEAPAGEGGGPAGPGEVVAGGRQGGQAAPEAPGGAGPRAAGGVKPELPVGSHESFKPASSFVDKAGNFRLENITDDEEVRQAIRDSVNLNHEFIDERRGVVSDDEAFRLADASGLKPSDLNRRAIGEAWNKEQIFALERLFIQAATDVKFAAQAAARAGTDEALMAYGEAEARQRMILDQVASHAAGVRAEAGRALQAFAALKKMKGSMEAHAVADVMMSSTGQTLYQLKQRAQAIAGLQTPSQVAGALVEMAKPGYGAMALEIFKNWLISGPITHMTYNIGTNLLALYKAVPETIAQAAVSQAREAITGERGTRVYYGEVGTQLYAMFFGQRDGWRAAWDSFKSGQTMELPEEALDMMIKVERSKYDTLRQHDPNVTHEQAITRLGIGGSTTPFSNTKAVPGIAGTIVRFPGERMVAPLHSYSRTIGYIQSIARQAYRIATNEGLTGDAFNTRMAELKTRPTADMMTIARNEATQQTLMGHGGELTKRVSALMNWEPNIPGLGPTKPFAFIDPFVHIASNIVEQSIVERSPAGLLSERVRADVMGKNGTAAQDAAISRIVAGTSLSLVAGGLAMEGLITPSAPSDPREAALFHMMEGQPHSLRVGNTSIELSRLGVLGFQMGIAADLYHMADRIGKDDASKIASLLVHSFTQNFLDEGFMRGPSDMIKALDEPDRYGASYVRNFVSSFIVPFSVGEGQIARQIDPFSREARTMIDSIKAKVPWLSETLQPRVDLWGEPIRNREWMGVYVQQLQNDPVNQRLKALGFFPSPVERKIVGVELTPEQHFEYASIAGRLAKMQLNALVASAGFATLPPGEQTMLIQKQIDAARKTAASRVKMMWPDIVTQALKAKTDKLTGKSETVH